MSSVSRSVGRPVSRSVLAGQSNDLASIIKNLFSNGEQGFFYDPNDLSTMFQDAAGTVPVTGAGQAVGLIKDKSGRNNHAYQTTSSVRPIFRQKPILGSDVAVNGSFERGNENWELISGGWTFANGLATSTGTITGLNYLTNINSEVVVGDAAEITVVLRNKGTKGTLGFSFSNGSDTVVWRVEGLYDGISLTSVNTVTVNNRIYITARDGWDGSIESVSIKKVVSYRTDQNYIGYDAIDDKLITNLPAQLTGCTVIRSVPNVGTQILTGQTIPATYNDNTDHCGLIVINRALTPSETSVITNEFNKRAGV